MWLTRRDCLAVLGAAGTGVLAPLRQGADAATPPPVLPDTLGLRGYDAVTYFLDGTDGPRPGRPGIELSWKGRAWRFAGRANREVFRDQPETYAPRLSGFDAVGIAHGRFVDADPLTYARLPFSGAERLYLFRTAENRDLARANPGLVAAAEARWPSLRAVSDLRIPD